jgi:hypothetical protein
MIKIIGDILDQNTGVSEHGLYIRRLNGPDR